MTRRPQAFVASSRLVLAVVLGALVAVNTLAAPATPALAEELSPAGLRALETVTACLQARPLLAVTIVIDESRSLRTTDPTRQPRGDCRAVHASDREFLGRRAGRS